MDEELPDSQSSLGLSQNTANIILEAARSYTEEFFITEKEEKEEESVEQSEMNGPSSISIQRTLFNCNMEGQFYTPATTSMQVPPSTPYSPYPPPPPLYHESISSANITCAQTTSPSQSPTRYSECSPQSQYYHHNMSPLQAPSYMPSLQPPLPSNMPFPGDFNFKLVFTNSDCRTSKTAAFTYSHLTKRAYIRRDVTVAFAFSLTNISGHTNDAVIRCMAMHKTPELIGEVLQCCPKHIEEQKKKGHLHPRHFICSAPNNVSTYCEDPFSGRLSLTLPLSSLQQGPDNTIKAFFTFPCFTSEISKGPGQTVQLIFTLEIEGRIAGRVVIDARVCASTGRDREHDESRVTSIQSLSTSETSRQGRKRSSSTITQQLECNIPSKVKPGEALCERKSLYSVNTYPELFPFLNVCVQMMERVYQVKVQKRDDSSSSAQDIFQDNLGSDDIDESAGSQPLSQSSSQVPVVNPSTLEVVRIQVKRSFSNSSSSDSI